jgi:hypothetical protein
VVGSQDHKRVCPVAHSVALSFLDRSQSGKDLLRSRRTYRALCAQRRVSTIEEKDVMLVLWNNFAHEAFRGGSGAYARLGELKSAATLARRDAKPKQRQPAGSSHCGLR